MGLNATLEKNFSWMAFPGLIRAIVMLQCVVFALIMMEPKTATFFMVTPDGLAKGEYWRLISWIFFPLFPPNSPMGPIASVVFFLITMKIMFLFSDSLEHAWGEVRTSFYIYACLLCQIAILFFIPLPMVGSEMFYLCVFFAFATLFPNHEFLLMLVLPVKVWILALFAVARLFYIAAKFPVIFPLFMVFYFVSFLPYLIWAIPRLRHWGKHKTQIANRRARFSAQTRNPSSTTLHCCVHCQRTEVSHPDLDFRVTHDGEEYCLDHLDEQGKPRPT